LATSPRYQNSILKGNTRHWSAANQCDPLVLSFITSQVTALLVTFTKRPVERAPQPSRTGNLFSLHVKSSSYRIVKKPQKSSNYYSIVDNQYSINKSTILKKVSTLH